MVWWKECLPFVAMVLVQLGYAGMNIFSKAAMEAGMTPNVLVTYRQILATADIDAPFAFFYREKKSTEYDMEILHQSIFWSFLWVKMEKLKIRERAGQTKVFRTIVCVGGAMVLSLYHGPRLHIPQPGMHWIFVGAIAKEDSGFGIARLF
uniref:WAT1-related protein n=1 Tax=Kalanchoe fedtschenkoi TaxID=63787 RepID=A0A7N0TSG9_KALFE